MASEITVLINAYRNGDTDALNQLAPMLYPELKAMAFRRSKSGPGMGATTLVSETFLKMLSGGELSANDRAQFFALAATIMRQIIIDEIRYVTAGKRSGTDVTLAETLLGDETHQQAEYLLQVDEMLSLLEAEDQQLARVFECRYFAGLTTAETAEALQLSARTVERRWADARNRIASLIEEGSE